MGTRPPEAPCSMPQSASTAFDELLRFERALVELSTGFIHRPPADVDAAIVAALHRIRETLDVERSSLLRLGADGVVYVSHSASVEGIEPIAPDVVPRYPWGIARLRDNRHVAFTSLSELPMDAAVDRASWARIGVASNMTVPIFLDGTFWGALAMATFRRERDWPDALVERARTLATMLGRALEHQRAQHELAGAVAFEQMVTQALADLVRTPRGELDPVIVDVLHRASVTLDADSVVLWQRDPHGDTLRPTHNFTREGVSLPPDVAGEATFPWSVGEILANRAVSTFVAAMPPEDAAVDIATLTALNAKSLVAVPIAFGGRVVGALAFASEDDTRGWPQSLLPRVQLFGEVLAFVLARDRAERGERDARAEAAHAARLGTMGVVAASLAHELTQPLAAIMTNAEMALELAGRDEVDQAELHATLEDILADDRRASELIAQLRRFLRRDELAHAELDIAALLREVMSLVRGEVVGKGVVLTLDCPDQLPRVAGNHAQVQQVLLNLLLNAFDAVANNAPSARQVVVTAQALQGIVQIAVSDNGTGMDAEAQARAFTPFYTTKPKGMGLGLSISRSIAQSHGGSLLMTSSPGSGSTFRLVLPAVTERRAGPRPGAPSEAGA